MELEACGEFTLMCCGSRWLSLPLSLFIYIYTRMLDNALSAIFTFSKYAFIFGKAIHLW